jgi:hypothetical protein
MADEGTIGSKVEMSDCPLTLFIKDGKEIAREKKMDYPALQNKIDDLYHGGKKLLEQP